jgi:succinyl-diaminopimelate desuccinylase
MPIIEKVFETIETNKGDMVDFLREIISIPAIGPMSGGEGEQKKADLLEEYLMEFGFSDIRHHDAADDRVPSGKRPNISVHLKGKSSDRRFVVITHIDVVPPGSLSDWGGDPFKMRRDGSKLFGRGVEDNGQALTASIFACRALMEMGVEPDHDVTIFFVSDEEESNEKGIGHLLSSELIGKNDLILVPDHGDPDGRVIEVCEKTLLWIKVTVKGRQCHASMPDLGNNAFRASMLFGTQVDRALHERFDRKDESFDHPVSSFEPTKREIGVEGINVLPGEDIFYFDCRLLPGYSKEEVIEEMEKIARETEEETGTEISFEIVFSDTTLHPTPIRSRIVELLTRAVKVATGTTPVTGGIGGGTCAALLRNSGFEVAVWETIHNRAHSPDEYILVNNMVKDCKVFTALFTLDQG